MRGTWGLTAATVSGVLILSGCLSSSRDGGPSSASRPGEACPPAASALAPESGALLGVSIDWEHDTLADYAERLGRPPAVTVTFAGMPLSEQDLDNVGAAVEQAAEQRSRLLLTLEPHRGLARVTDHAIEELTTALQQYNTRVPVIVRFAHEMNGSWYAWGQQPAAYVETFRRVAAAVHRDAPASSMMWAPSYGGGYPFIGGRHAADVGSRDGRLLDTNRDGRLDERDDGYRPYYPGDDAVDWVGMSLYHWGTRYPWGENEVPADDKLVDQLTGRYHGAGVDERVVPDFHGVYGHRHGKPVAITETAALYAPGAGGASEREIKAAWWSQVLAPDLLERLPNLRMVSWFEWDKFEPEVDGHVDWTVTRDPALRRDFVAALPDWLAPEPEAPACA
jgi:hypothetical protein